MTAPKHRRFSVAWDWSSVPFPHLVICDPDEDGTWLALRVGPKWSEPFFNLGWQMPRPLDAPFVWWHARQWDRRVRRQRAA